MIIRDVSSEQRERTRKFLRETFAFPHSLHSSHFEEFTIVEDVTPTEFKVEDLEFVSPLDRGESYVGGWEIRKRAIGLEANFGIEDGRKILLGDHKLPVELQGKGIALTGTLLCDLGGTFFFPGLYYDECCCVWKLFMIQIDTHYRLNVNYRLPRRK